MVSMNFDIDDVLSKTLETTCEGSSRNQRKSAAVDSDVEPIKARYVPGVLVGDWYERRAEYKPPPDDWRTLYDLNYTCKPNPDLKEDKRHFEDIKFRGREGIGSEFLLEYPGTAFVRNFSTTNDLTYRILPTGLCGPRTRRYSSRLDQWIPELDLSKNYGNATKTGLMEAVECENYMNSLKSPRKSLTKRHYLKPKLSHLKQIALERRPRPSAGNMNDPCLCHLDIDPDYPFRRHLIRTRK